MVLTRLAHGGFRGSESPNFITAESVLDVLDDEHDEGAGAEEQVRGCQKFAGGRPYRIFLVDIRARVNDTTPVRPRRGTGLAFPGGRPFRF
jgi:hypothetical protein